MAQNTSKSGLDNLVKSVLSVGNQEQNFFWPPHIISSQINVVTSLLMDRLVKSYPENVDMLLPFIEEVPVLVKDGYIDLPDEYRNLLGASISARKNGDTTTECGDLTEEEFKLKKLKSGCQSRPIVIVSKGKWDYRTTSEFNYPTYWNPIGIFVGSQIKVCPFDIKAAKITIVQQESIYKYGYVRQPDDTFIFDPDTSVDTEWDNAAFTPLFKAMLALYSAYSRDPTLTDWSRVLHNEGIL